MKKLFVVLSLALLALIGILLGRTALYRSQQQPVETAELIPVDGQAAAARLAGAIRFKTISHQIPWEFKGVNFTDLHAYLAEQFPKVHATLQREVVANYSLLYTWPGSDPSLKPVILLGHMDVVPVDAASALDWKQPPFDGVIDGGYVWGRGALDDKSSVCAMLEAAETLLNAGFQPKRTVYFAFGHDEELGGPQGAGSIAALLASRGIKAAFSLDEGSGIVQGILPGIAAPVALISVCEKGYVTLQLKATGQGGHSSQPPPHTAIGQVAGAVARLEAQQMPAHTAGPLLTMLQTVGPEMDFPLRLVLANLWLFKPVLRWQLLKDETTAAALRTTTAPTIFNAGTKDNVLPVEATAMVNFRILPGDSIDDVVAHARSVINDPAVQVSASEDKQAVNPSPVSDHRTEAFAALGRSVRQVYPEVPVAPGMTIAGTDSKHYYAVAENLYRLQPLLFDKAALATIHGTDERVSIDTYVKAIQIYGQILRNTCG